MRTIWMGISARPEETRILATAGAETTLLKARLAPRPSHPRALTTLLEAIALWQGMRVRAALAVDEKANGYGTSRCGDFVGDEHTPLYELNIVPDLRRARRRDELGGLGDFRDLRQLLLFEVAR
jgi:hypothetical protein